MRIYSLIPLFLCLVSCSSISTQLSNSQDFAKSVYLSENVPTIFGGVRLNAEMATQIPSSEAGLFGLIYVLIDTPLSLVTDIILLPYTLSKTDEQETDTSE
jgi:uncharacterized protein YceK